DGMEVIVSALERELGRSDAPPRESDEARVRAAERTTQASREGTTLAAPRSSPVQTSTMPLLVQPSPPPLAAPLARGWAAREPAGCWPIGVLVVGIGLVVFGLVLALLGLAMFAPPVSDGDRTTGAVMCIVGGAVTLAGAAVVVVAAVMLRRARRLARI